MTKKYATKQFNQFLPMIEKACWHYSKKYKIDHSEISGQGYLIFCEALKTFDKNKSTFSTYLSRSLNIKLFNFCKKILLQRYNICKNENNSRFYFNFEEPKCVLLSNLTDKDTVYSFEKFDKVITKMDYEISLSNDAKEIVEYILSRDWEILDDNWKPRFSFIQKKYLSEGWTRNRIVTAWENIAKWWQSSNKDQFCLEV